MDYVNRLFTHLVAFHVHASPSPPIFALIRRVNQRKESGCNEQSSVRRKSASRGGWVGVYGLVRELHHFIVPLLIFKKKNHNTQVIQESESFPSSPPSSHRRQLPCDRRYEAKNSNQQTNKKCPKPLFPDAPLYGTTYLALNSKGLVRELGLQSQGRSKNQVHVQRKTTKY